MTSSRSQPRINTGRLLLRKEFNESTSALLVGLAIYVFLPSMWTLIMAVLDPRDGIFPGIASILWLLTGWLFSAVLGAQIVCRDLGTPLERFLLARPITEAQVLGAKARVGFLLILLIAVVIGALEVLWLWLAPTYRGAKFSGFGGAYVLATGLSACAYWMAFAAACITRRSLTSSLAATFTIVVMVTIPMIVRIRGLPEMFELLYDAQRNYSSLALAFIVLFITPWVVALAVRRVFASSERRITIGSRQLIWTATLTLAGLFVLAMREVGASQPLTVTCWHSKNTKDNRPVRFAVGPHRVATSTDDRLAQLIDLDDSGRIARTRKMNRVVSSALIDQAESYGREVWVFDDDGDLNSIRRVQTNYRKEQDWICNWQLVLRKLNWERGTVGAPILLPWPSDRQRHENCYVVDFLFEESRLYVLMSTSIGKTGSNEIVVYQVNSENATVLDSASFHSQARYISGFDSIWGTRSINTPPRRLGVRGEGLDFLFWFDPNTPVAKLQSAIGSPAFDNVIEYFPRCDRSGLKVIQNNWIPIDQRRWSCDSDGVIGRVHASPLANLFRSEYLRLSSAGPNRWVELHLRQAIVYDLTDPAHPQRIGHITAPFCLEGTVSGDFLVMAHGPGFSVARLPSIEKH